MSRMKILNSTEQGLFDKPPIFDSYQRKQIFDIPMTLLEKANNLRKPAYKIGFLVACGYFKATKKFFNPEDYHQRDIEYVARVLDTTSEKYSSAGYSRSRIHHHRQAILTTYGFRQFDKEVENTLILEITAMVRAQLKPKLISWRNIEILGRKRICLPSSHRLSEIISTCFNERKRELTALIERELTDETKSILDQLFIQEQSPEKEKEAHNVRYKLTLLKRLSQSTRPTKIKERANDLFYLKELYEHVKPILPLLKLGHEGIRFYAKGVIKADIFQLNQRSVEDRYIHVIAFIVHQYYSLQDNLTDVLLSVIQSHKNSVARDHRDRCYENRKQQDQSLKILLKTLDETIFNVLSGIRSVLENGTIKDTDKISYIKNLLAAPEQAEAKSKELKEVLKQTKDDEYFEIVEDRSLRLQNRINPIIKSLDFQGDSGSVTELIKGIEYFKVKDGSISKNAPIGFLEEEQRTAVNADGGFHPSLYKVFLFLHIASAIKSGTLNLKHSHKYRPLDDYIISKERWAKEQDILIERAELTDFVNHELLLNNLDEKLHQQYQSTNKSYQENKSPHLKIKPNGDFTIRTPKQNEVERDNNLALQSFFPEEPVFLTEVLATVNRHTNFLEEFEHWQHRYTKNRPTDKILYAGIMGKGCAIGTPKIARISSQINETNLNHVVNWYFSLDNIRAANDRILKLLNNMELPEIYRRSKNMLHTASDGQKFTVRADSLNANYSFKYFGQEQGISAYTFIDMRNLLWHSRVLSAADRESAFVIDGLMHNDVIKSDIHSTDTHGYSEVIFATTHLLSISYAPRIKNLKKKTLYTFKSRKKLNNIEYGIKPEKYINRAIIEETWDDILRLIATIKLKETTASDIFRRLNSYSKQHRLYHGLKAFGQIIKSDFILRYLNEIELRQAIEKQLNKVELANRFTRDVAVGNPRDFIQGEQEEQEIAEASNRLVKNSIICWNYLYLADKLARLEHDPKQYQILLTAIANHSVMSWAHINMLGEYDFSDEKLKDSFGIRPPRLLS